MAAGERGDVEADNNKSCHNTTPPHPAGGHHTVQIAIPTAHCCQAGRESAPNRPGVVRSAGGTTAWGPAVKGELVGTCLLLPAQ
jgi:hypothetical protein